MESLSGLLLIGFALLVHYLAFRLLISPWFWKLVAVGIVITVGLAISWGAAMAVGMVIASFIAFMRWSCPPGARYIPQAYDSRGRPSGHSDFQKP